MNFYDRDNFIRMVPVNLFGTRFIGQTDLTYNSTLSSLSEKALQLASEKSDATISRIEFNQTNRGIKEQNIGYWVYGRTKILGPIENITEMILWD